MFATLPPSTPALPLVISQATTTNPYYVHPASVNDGKKCSFLSKLPLEVREVVYKYMLKEEVELDMTRGGEEFRPNKAPNYPYRFNTSVLEVCQQVKLEASATFAREFHFVKLSVHSRPILEHHLAHIGLPILAEGERAARWQNVLIDIYFGEKVPPLEEDVDFEEMPRPSPLKSYIFGSEDLDTFCHVFRKVRTSDCWSDQGLGVNLPCTITVDESLGNDLGKGQDGFVSRSPKLERLLEQLKDLRGLERVETNGLSNEAYSKKLVDCMCTKVKSAADVLLKVSQCFHAGNKAIQEGDSALAVVKYAAGLDTLSSMGSALTREWALNLGGGWEADSTVTDELYQYHLWSHVRLAACFLKMRKLTMARVLTERVLGPCRGHDDQNFVVHVLLHMASEAQRHLIADALIIAAQVSYLQGDVQEAQIELDQAIKLKAKSDLYQPLLAEFAARCNVLDLKRYDQAEAAIDISLNRSNKGDRAFQRGYYTEALSRYQAALEEVKDLTSDMEHQLVQDALYDDRHKSFLPYCHLDEPLEGFRFTLQTRIAHTYLKLGNLDPAESWADCALEHSELVQVIWEGIDLWWICFFRKHLSTAYLCSGAGIEERGLTGRAIDDMALALVCNKKNVDACHRLGLLQQKLEAERKELTEGYNAGEENEIERGEKEESGGEENN